MLSLPLFFLFLLTTTTTSTLAQDVNPAFIYQCKPGVWALTFDDGPSPHTERLLKFLDDAAIKASFFIQGDKLKNASRAAQTKIAYEKGHQICSHTYSHPDLSTLTAPLIKEQMDKNAKLLKDLIGVTPHYMRPPYGHCNAQCADFMKQNEYGVVQWNVDSKDWRYHKEPAQRPLILKNMQKNELDRSPVSTASGYISLQHDTEFFSVDYVPQIIAKIKEQGFTFSTVHECIDNPPYPMYREAVAPPVPAPGGPTNTPEQNAPRTNSPEQTPIEPTEDAVPLVSTPSLATPSRLTSWTLWTFSVGLCTLCLFPLPLE